MHALVALLFFVALPFWEARPPEKWTDQDIDFILTQSPWVQNVDGLQVYLATAKPIEEALAERATRSRKPVLLLDPDYLDYLREHVEDSFVLAIPYDKRNGMTNGLENKRMEQETQMKIGKKTYKILGYFPPTSTDPVLRLVFPREVKPTDKTVEFRLYVPGVNFPERDASFFVKDLLYHQKIEM